MTYRLQRGLQKQIKEIKEQIKSIEEKIDYLMNEVTGINDYPKEIEILNKPK